MGTGDKRPIRTSWIIAGILGCLVVCVLIAVVGGVGYFVLSPQASSGLATNTPTRVSFATATTASAGGTPTQVSFTVATPTALATSTQGAAPATATATRAAAQPTVTLTRPAPTSAYDVVGIPTATSTSSPFEVVGVPTQAPAQPTKAAPPPTPARPAPTTAPTTAPTPSASSYWIAYSVDEGPSQESKSLWIVKSDGTNPIKLTNLASHPILSRDGNQLVFYHWTDGLYILNATDPQKPTLKHLVKDTFTGGDYGSGDWSHDGRWIAFTKQPGGKGNIVVDVIAPDGSGQHTVQIGESPSWSPDDTMLVFHTCRANTCGIYKGSVNGGDAIPIVGDDGGLPAWSPDGKQIVYQKEVDGQKQLFLIAPDGSGKKQITSGPSMHVDANWSPDGRYIFYRSPEGGTWAIWRMNTDGSNRVKLLDNVAPVNWPYERLSISR